MSITALGCVLCMLCVLGFLYLSHLQVPCRGRGQSPTPLAVNMAVWEIRKALMMQPNIYILVHCTHGFNRSGEWGRALLPGQHQQPHAGGLGFRHGAAQLLLL